MELDVDLFTASGGDVLASVVDLEPGPLLMSVLLSIDPTSLDPTAAVDYVVLHERVSAWWASRQVDAVVAAAGGHPMVEELLVHLPDRDEQRRLRIADAAREEIATALRWPLARTQDTIDTCRLLDGPLMATRVALSDGSISSRHVSVIVEAAKRLPGAGTVLRQPADDDTPADRADRAAFAACCVDLEARCLPVAKRSTVAATRRSAERALLAIDAAGAARRRDAARRTADAFVIDEPDGMSTLMARMATEHAHACLAAIERAAADPQLPELSGGENPASAGQRRSAALRLLIMRDSGLASAHTRAEIQVTIDLASLAALARGIDDASTAEAPDRDGATPAPAHITGAGAITSEAVRDLLADPTVAVSLRRLVTDPLTGHLLDYGRRTYAIPEPLRQFIIARDRTCRFPGCRRKAQRCQIDHAVAWDDGGATGPPNLGALCTRHHQLKTHGGWCITTSEASGACTWTSPQGRAYVREPESPTAA